MFSCLPDAEKPSTFEPEPRYNYAINEQQRQKSRKIMLRVSKSTSVPISRMDVNDLLK